MIARVRFLEKKGRGFFEKNHVLSAVVVIVVVVVDVDLHMFLS